MENHETYKQLRAILSDYKPIPDGSWNTIVSYLKLKEIASNEIYIDYGDQVSEYCYLVDGAAYGYEQKENDSQVVRLWNTNSFILLGENFLVNSASNMRIVFSKASTIITLPTDAESAERIPACFAPYFNYLLSNELNYHKEAVRIFRQNDTKKRVEWLIQEFGDVTKELPDEKSAQVIGVSRKWYNFTKRSI